MKMLQAEEKLSGSLGIRVQQKTANHIKRNARKAHMTVSTYLRFCIETIEEKYGLPTFEKEFPSEKKSCG